MDMDILQNRGIDTQTLISATHISDFGAPPHGGMRKHTPHIHNTLTAIFLSMFDFLTEEVSVSSRVICRAFHTTSSTGLVMLWHKFYAFLEVTLPELLL